MFMCVCIYVCVCVCVCGRGRDKATLVESLHKVDCISHYIYTFEIAVNPIILSPAMGK